eukprot:CAMPEP_0202860048 /NCGR_PEP_ID=MMETSP1391-20130828/1919_1 /ASSEMBLY_ACC=CAM_ASM_000867 /TAXON_ID=1034604 /ORGANISM="Chlamydomonas leiostraca, Strain SAG 11-49" /LENGTH=530 /DNA_ID=CAMNT_0049539175 /DNA_START=21 /DNA_END=1610 /DNA_ORIENTATION=-
MACVIRSKLFASSKQHGAALIAEEHGMGKRSSSFSCPGGSNPGSRSGSAVRVRRTSMASYSSQANLGEKATDEATEEPERSSSGVQLKGAGTPWEMHLRSHSTPAQLPANTATLREVACLLAKQQSQATVLLVDSNSKRLQGIITRKDFARIKQARQAHAPVPASTNDDGPAPDAVLEAAAGAWWARGEEPAMLWAVNPVVALPLPVATPGAAAALMLGYGVSHLDEEGRAVCVLTQASVAAFLVQAEEEKALSGNGSGADSSDGVLSRLMLGAGVRDLDTRFDELSHLAAAVPPPKLSTPHLPSVLPPLPPSPLRRPSPSSRLAGSSSDLALMHASSPHAPHKSEKPHASDGSSTTITTTTKGVAGKSLMSMDEDHKIQALVMDSAWDVLDGVAGMLAVSAAAAACDPAAVAAAATTVASAGAGAAHAAGAFLHPAHLVSNLVNAGQDSRDVVRMLSEVLRGVSVAGVVSGVPSAVQALVGPDCAVCQTVRMVVERLDHHGAVQFVEAGAGGACGAVVDNLDAAGAVST